jgi:hypothetical protein
MSLESYEIVTSLQTLVFIYQPGTKYLFSVLNFVSIKHYHGVAGTDKMERDFSKEILCCSVWQWKGSMFAMCTFFHSIVTL